MASSSSRPNRCAHKGVLFPAGLPLPAGLECIPLRVRVFSLPVPVLRQKSPDCPAACCGGSTPQGTLVGVGMEFDSQRMIITSLRPGCAAAYSKQITIGDQLVAVDGQEVCCCSHAFGVQGLGLSSSLPCPCLCNGSSDDADCTRLLGADV